MVDTPSVDLAMYIVLGIRSKLTCYRFPFSTFIYTFVCFASPYVHMPSGCFKPQKNKSKIIETLI